MNGIGTYTTLLSKLTKGTQKSDEKWIVYMRLISIGMRKDANA